MHFVNNMNIATKVAALLVMLGVVTIGLTFTSHRTIKSIDARYSALSAETLPATTDLVRTNRRAVEMLLAGYQILAHDPASAQARSAAELVKEARAAGIDNLDNAERTDPALAEVLPKFRQQFEQLSATASRAVDLGLAGRDQEALRALTVGDRQLAALSNEWSTFNKGRVAQTDLQTTELNQYAASATWWMLLVSIIAVAAGLAAGILASRKMISAPLVALQETMRALASGNNRVEVAGTARRDEVGFMSQAVLVFRDAALAQEQAAVEKAKADADQKFVVDTVSEKLASVSRGDLTAEIKVEFPDTYAELRTNFNGALSNLRELIGSVMESATALRAGSHEIAQASEDLARRTESNAASLEETSAALAQIDGRIKATAEAGGRTVERADEAIATVSGGRTIADEAVEAMSRVRESARGIDEVIEGVDKIAFQTRVLAMNAAVEAGRAGDAGRGFAVVADLVSALAMRAEEEAKRARDQLSVTQGDIVSAVSAVQKIDGALTEISEGVGEVHMLLGSMASDNNAQASAITQISAAVADMDQSTQQNAAMVEETSAAARNLHVEAEGLAEKASQFRVADRVVVPAPAPPIAQRASHFSPVPVGRAIAANGAGRSKPADSWQAF